MESIDITIIGAGIIGLAVADKLAGKNRSIYVLETLAGFGQEASSRNSEVIHAGIYYPPNSLKALACVEGNRLTYEICQNNNIAYKKLGKLIVASTAAEIRQLEQLQQNGQNNGVSGLEILDRQAIKRLEPAVEAQAALYSPETGIVDSHNLMRYFFQQAQAAGVEFAWRTEAARLSKDKQGYTVFVRDADGSDFSFSTKILINCAGLNSASLADSVGIDIKKKRYLLKYCKGQYFRLSNAKSALVKRLIYPVPDSSGVSLGIHATPDLDQGLRLGPDASYIEKDAVNYDIDLTQRAKFAQDAGRFLPFIEVDDLTADTAGIRAKLQGPNEDVRDFVICHEEDNGFPGFVNLIGIDSPGLTSAAFIGGYVEKIVSGLL
ncbi:NAD(P)/FAD-dependent oxidoreductase [Candidatus Omnitrophota bacterium]